MRRLPPVGSIQAFVAVARQGTIKGAADALSLVRNGWFMVGLGAYAISVLTWLFVLKRVPLTIAAPFVALVYVLVPLASRVFFDA